MFLSPKNSMCKIYFVPIVQEMTAIWSVWLCTHKQTLGPMHKILKDFEREPKFFWGLWPILAYKNEKCSGHKKAYNSYPAPAVLYLVDLNHVMMNVVTTASKFQALLVHDHYSAFNVCLYKKSTLCYIWILIPPVLAASAPPLYQI